MKPTPKDQILKLREQVVRLTAERDVARRERDEANGAWFRVNGLRAQVARLTKEVARLTEERDRLQAFSDRADSVAHAAGLFQGGATGDPAWHVIDEIERLEARVLQLQTALQSLLNVAPSVLHKTCRYDGCIYCCAREVLAAVPDPPIPTVEPVES